MTEDKYDKQKAENIDPNELYGDSIDIASRLTIYLDTLQEVVNNEKLSDYLFNCMISANDLTTELTDLKAYFPVENRWKKSGKRCNERQNIRKDKTFSTNIMPTLFSEEVK